MNLKCWLRRKSWAYAWFEMKNENIKKTGNLNIKFKYDQIGKVGLGYIISLIWNENLKTLQKWKI